MVAAQLDLFLAIFASNLRSQRSLWWVQIQQKLGTESDDSFSEDEDGNVDNCR